MPELGVSPAYALRPATADDFAFLYDLHNATIKEYVAQTTRLTCAWQCLALPRVDLAVPERHAQMCTTRHRKEFST